MLCVCNYTEESTERKEKVSTPVVRNKDGVLPSEIGSSVPRAGIRMLRDKAGGGGLAA